MAVAQGSCPSCGAPIEFGIGSSIAKVCEYCRATIVRSDRGLENLGKVADLANTPSLIAVGDQGTLADRPFEVLGRVQLDHGKGPWDEYYVSFEYGQSWGWLAYAQGRWYVTQQVPGIALPPFNALSVEMDVPLGQSGNYRVAEVKTGTIVSAEGELPGPFPAGFVRHYADCYAPQNGFATLDYGDNRGSYSVFLGWIFEEAKMVVTQVGPRTAQKVKAAQIKCPQCGGDIPKLSGERAERIGCPYCGAISDIALQQVVAQQERAMQMPDIPIGSRGVLDGVEYICIAYMRRSSDFEGERFTWEEFLLWAQPLGFRWLVKDPETGWSFVNAANLAEIELTGLPNAVTWGGRHFRLRNRNVARVDYVLGEVYWKCELGEETQVMDFVSGNDVLSREAGSGEANWSYSTPTSWAVIAQAFGLPMQGAGAMVPTAGGGSSGGCASSSVLIIIVVLVLLICLLGSCGSCLGGGGGGSYGGSGIRGGSGVWSGGK
jgi:Domain of unknown function (DUF4178)